MKLCISKGMKCNENSYLLQEAVNSTEMLQITACDAMLHIIQFTLMTEHILWALFSNGILYEYDLRTKTSEIIEKSRDICSYAIQ